MEDSMIFDLTITQFTKMLHNLDTMLDKGAQYADHKKFDTTVLMSSRLAPDQFALTRQIQIACDTAKLAAHRLTTKEAPSHPDTEATWAELRTRIQDTIKYLGTFTPKDFEMAATRQITQPRWEGKWMTGEEFVMNHVVPNFYFHVTTAYAIMRHNGVEVGKKDYLGQMPYKK
jgi:hypothetical protein